MRPIRRIVGGPDARGSTGGPWLQGLKPLVCYGGSAGLKSRPSSLALPFPSFRSRPSFPWRGTIPSVLEAKERFFDCASRPTDCQKRSGGKRTYRDAPLRMTSGRGERGYRARLIRRWQAHHGGGRRPRLSCGRGSRRRGAMREECRPGRRIAGACARRTSPASSNESRRR